MEGCQAPALVAVRVCFRVCGHRQSVRWPLTGLSFLYPLL